MALVRFCPAAVLKDLLTGDFEQHFREFFWPRGGPGGRKKAWKARNLVKKRVFLKFRRMKKHVWEASWIRKVRRLGRRKRELPRRGCVFCPQTQAKPREDLLTSDFEECFRLSGGARASFEKDASIA